MYCRSIRGILLAVLILYSQSFATCEENERAESAIAVATSITALVAQDTRFQPRLQLRTSLEAGMLVTWPSRVELGAGLELIRVVPSAVIAGYGYPGWVGRAAWISAQYRLEDPGRLGFRLRAAVVLAGFDSTFLVAFFPVVEFAPVLFIGLPGRREALLRLTTGWELRRDLGLTITGGFTIPGALYGGVSFSITSGLPRLRDGNLAP